jgi:hypothetical protein
MKKIFIKKACLCLLITSLFGCTSFVEDINVDPDLISDADGGSILQGALIANQFFQTSGNVRDAMLWLNQANGEDRQYLALNNWNNSTAGNFDGLWNGAYVNVITQTKIISAKATASENSKLKGVAQVVEAHCIGTITSLWGDAPYSAIDTDGKNLTPKYDAQADIYSSIQTTLDEAIANLAAPGKIPSDKDLYYAGDASKWMKLAYTLKARFYLHTKEYAKAKTNALLGIDSPSGDFMAKFGPSYGQSFNPFYSFLVYDRDSYMSGDSYAARLLDPTAALYRGNAKTDESARFAFTYSQEGNYFAPYELNYLNVFDWGQTNGKFGGDSSMPMVTYGESLLIIAEVDARNTFASGLTSYNRYRALLNNAYSIGIDNSGYESATFAYLPYTSNDFIVGGSENSSGNLTTQNALLREIFQERYIYFLGNYESFNDYGRSNNMAEIQLKTGFDGTPQRFLYPQVEINSNPNTPNPIPSIVTKTPAHN